MLEISSEQGLMRVGQVTRREGGTEIYRSSWDEIDRLANPENGGLWNVSPRPKTGNGPILSYATPNHAYINGHPAQIGNCEDMEISVHKAENFVRDLYDILPALCPD